jgi:cytochrome c-type biogenesis protein CcmH/NrfG
MTLATAAACGNSATWDEPMHLTAGYAALARGDFRVDPSHPPLLRMWAALPLLIGDAEIDIDTRPIDGSAPSNWLGDAYRFAHRFMYIDNDADRMLARGRTMVVLLGVALGAVLFAWARAWFGVVPAAVVMLLFALAPNLLAHGGLVTTDFGVTVFVFAAIYFLWRACERPTALTIAAAACCAALALISKFSAVLLAPIVLMLLALAVARRVVAFRMAAAIAAAMIVVAIATIWAAYGFRYLPSDTAGWAFDFTTPPAGSGGSIAGEVAGWIDRYRLLPNAYTQGFVYAQSSSQQMPSFLAGQRSADGWWYYFPLAFLIKTPLALLLLSAAGLLAALADVRRVGAWRLAVLFVPAAVFLGAAMASGINLGLRHVLPIYPFVLLVAGAGIQHILATRGRWAPLVLATALAATGLELARAYPTPLAFFNLAVGGPANGYRYLADSNVDWGADLKRLDAWMDRNRVTHVNLAYFGQADPRYYGIDATHLPGAPGFATDAIARPRLPGYVALSATLMHGVYSPPEWQLFYEPFRDLEPAAVLGHALRIYWIDEWPLPAQSPSLDEAAVDARRTLADAVMFGLQWPDLAVRYYREYLRHRPRDGDALLNLGVALAAAGRIPEVVPTLESAVHAVPDHGRARLALARALFGSGRLAEAAAHARRAVALLPDDADAHDFLGRVHAAQGRPDEALAEFRRALEIDPTHPPAREHLGILQGQHPWVEADRSRTAVDADAGRGSRRDIEGR